MYHTHALAADLPFYNIFVLKKVPPSKISDDVIVCDLWFAPPPPNQKVLATPMQITRVLKQELEPNFLSKPEMELKLEPRYLRIVPAQDLFKLKTDTLLTEVSCSNVQISNSQPRLMVMLSTVLTKFFK